MANFSVAAEWQLLGNRFYRKLEIYQMLWKHVDLSRNKVACSPFGGPIAIIRDDSKIVQLYSESARRKLRIFNSAGILIAETVWKHAGGRLIGMSWTDDQTLICIVQDGTIYRYNINAECLEPNYSMGKECFEQTACFEGTLFCVADFKDIKPYKLADPAIGMEDELPHCMAVIEPQYTLSGNVLVLLGVADGIVTVEDDDVRQVESDDLRGPVHKLAVHIMGGFWRDLRMMSALPPEQMAWCELDSVLLYRDDMLLVVGPSEFCISYIDEPVILIPDCDGVRILSNTTMDFLQRVPDSTESIFKIGSTSPASLLVDALDHFDRRSAKAQENLRLIRTSLPEAVEACVDAAGHEFDVYRQRTLLRGASYGLVFFGFGSNFQCDCIQEMCKTLWVLNAVCDSGIGIPLIIQQYKSLTAPVLIGRLINAHKHLLEVVIMHWPSSKITASLGIPDATLLEILLDKLKVCKGISYAAVAAHIPLLLSIGEGDMALTKATESGDPDLAYLVLFHIWRKRPALEFLGTIQARSVARYLFITFARSYKHEFLKDFFLSTGQLQVELGKNPIASKGSPLHGPRIKLIEKAQNHFSETKEHTFEIQHELEVSTKQAIFVDSSITDTIRTCIVLGNHRAAMKVKMEFKVSEKRWYLLEVFALATIRDWDALEKFSKEKRPPIGYRPFVEACIDADEKGEALKYIPRLADPRERAEDYTRIGMAKEAADAASQAKDGDLLG
ncbi:hypothetical protein P3X46_016035 [Hevea brasiliensis]|uniref:Protein VACUOLELESS1 n=1 Tax=Hevea brasiliensis TaxID=3981 RepID=A0ABQ9M1S2_HEVBR|nr:hypothetical protein P3X46_016035 [Hevea brasiliensis]